MDISIVILNYNDKDYLKGCLESLANCSKSRQVEIIVSDNHSTDGSNEMVQTRFPHVILIRNNANLGFTKGNNAGIRASKGKYVYLLNPDIKVLEGCIDGLADFLDRNPAVGIAGPKILNRDMTHQSSCRRYPTLWNNFCEVAGLAKFFRGSRFFSGEHMFYFRGDRVMDVNVLVGCFSALRREAFEQVGLLDEGYYMYGDDLDWCRRFRQAGWRVVFFPGAQAIHYMGTSTTKRDPIRYAIMQQTSVLRDWDKYHGLAGRWSIGCLMFSSLLIRWCLAWIQSILRPADREAKRLKMRISSACLGALFGAGPKPDGITRAGSPPQGVMPPG